jgi:hypothetical protein
VGLTGWLPHSWWHNALIFEQRVVLPHRVTPQTTLAFKALSRRYQVSGTQFFNPKSPARFASSGLIPAVYPLAGCSFITQIQARSISSTITDHLQQLGGFNIAA